MTPQLTPPMTPNTPPLTYINAPKHYGPRVTELGKPLSATLAGVRVIVWAVDPPRLPELQPPSSPSPPMPSKHCGPRARELRPLQSATQAGVSTVAHERASFAMVANRAELLVSAQPVGTVVAHTDPCLQCSYTRDENDV
jgi:hypothetical protein